jgi:hypothetical protein
MTRDEVRQLLDLIVFYDDRFVTSGTLDFWYKEANRYDWDFDISAQAVVTYYEWTEEEELLWPNGGTRKIMQSDIQYFNELGRVNVADAG